MCGQNAAPGMTSDEDFGLIKSLDKGYPSASLAVQKANAAFRLYSNLGFEIVDENEEEYIMVYRF